jgi:hypothetical protein
MVDRSTWIVMAVVGIVFMLAIDADALATTSPSSSRDQCEGCSDSHASSTDTDPLKEAGVC